MRNHTALPFCLFGCIVMLCSSIVPLAAQSIRAEIAADPYKAGNTYYSYPTPEAVYTPTPKGYTAFYISHYGRHGSRWRINATEYSLPVAILTAADQAGQLTAEGARVLAICQSVATQATDRYGELTALGVRQHRDIAERMYSNFPTVFADSAIVDARSTIVIRCILSMDAACQQFKAHNPALRISNDASAHDMYYMNAPDTPDNFYNNLYRNARVAIDDFEARHLHPQRLMKVLFTHPQFVRELQLPQDTLAQDYSSRLMRGLFDVAVGMQCIDAPQPLIDVFHTDELYDLWACNTFFWYILFGNSSLTGGHMPFWQSNLLDNILETAQAFIDSGAHGATLRYGHDSVFTGLAVLLELGSYGQLLTHPETQLEQWVPYQLVPMAANLQFVFYRNAAENVLVKVLLNEKEIRLPLESPTAPYYLWNDVYAYYRNKLEAGVISPESQSE